MTENIHKSPILYVLGAGPGDPELITLKGYKLLQNAKVVLYDNLANKALLEFCPKECICIYVGKQPYGEYTPQEKIHELILEYAFLKGEVIRLKGGDPFIFGRGYEEIQFARSHRIQTNYIPGITSMQAFGLEDIPLTHRELSEGLWAITGRNKNGQLSHDLKLAIESRSTVIIYMGMKQLEQISKIYSESGKGDIPAAIIQNASLPNKKFARGMVGDLVKMAAENQITYPAIILIGPVIALEN